MSELEKLKQKLSSLEKEYDEDYENEESMANDLLFQAESIMTIQRRLTYLQEKEIELLQQHNNVLFKTIREIIEKFENTPLDENGTHRFIVGHDVLVGLKEALIKAGYEL